MKEISKQGGPRANRRSDGEATRMVRRKPKRMSYARRRGIAGIALLVGLLLIGVALIDYLAGGDDEIGRGVSIGSVDVGGMSREEAEEGRSRATPPRPSRRSPSAPAKRRSPWAATTSA